MFWQWLFLGDHKFLWFVFAFAIFNDIFLSSLCDMYGTGSNNTISLVNSLMKESYTFWAPDQASIQQFILTSLVGTVTRKHVWLSYTMVDSFILVIFYLFLFLCTITRTSWKTMSQLYLKEWYCHKGPWFAKARHVLASWQMPGWGYLLC